jgi:integrase/recombinase XerD
MSRFTSPIAEQIDRFLTHKRGLGFAYGNEEWLLGELDRLAADLKLEGILGEPMIRRFLARGTPGSRSNRLTLVRQFARFLAVEEPRTFVPPRRFLGIRRQKSVIRVLSRDEAGRFLKACCALTDSPQYHYRGLIHGTLLHVLLVTGLRRGEALALKVSDVDLDAGVFTIRCGKFGKSRFVPVAEDLAERLRKYDGEMGVRVPDRCAADAFFPGPDGHSAGLPASLYQSFRRALNIAGIKHGGRGEGPRLHDLRHGFAVLRLLAWYEQGADLSAKLPLLATYLGHLGISTLQVYLHMTHDLVGEVIRRYEARFGDVITAEVSP